MKKIVLVIFSLLIVFNVSHVMAVTPDSEGPKLYSLNLKEDNKTYNAEDRVYLNLKAKDDISGIKWISILFSNKNSSFYSNVYDIDTNPYIIIPKNVLGDTYYVENIDLCDNSENQSRYGRKNSEKIYGSILLNIGSNENNNAKDFDPKLSNIKFEKSVVKSGETQTIAMDVDQEYEFGDSSNYVRIINSNEDSGNYNNYIDIPLSYNSSSKKLEGSVVLDGNSAQYYIDCIQLSSKYAGINQGKIIHYLSKYSGSQINYFCNEPNSGFNCVNEEIGFKFEGNVIDRKAPELKSAYFSQKSTIAPSYVKIFVDASDNSGFMKNPRVIIKKIDDNGNIDENATKRIDLYYDETSKLYYGTVDFNQYTKSGKYYIYEVFVEDNNMNKKSYCINKEMDNSFFNSCIQYNIYSPVDMSNIKYGYIEIVDEFNYDLVLSLGNDDLIEKINEAKDDAVIMIDSYSSDIVKKEVFDSIKGTNKTVYFEKNGIQWVFNGQDITNATKDININLNTSILYDEKLDNSDKKYVSLEFADNGLLPGKAKVRIKAAYTYRYENGIDILQLYYHYGDSYYKVIDNIKITNDGFYEFDITHNSVYVLTNEDMPKDVVSEENIDNVLNYDNNASDNTTNSDNNSKNNIYVIIVIIVGFVVIIAVTCLLVYKKKKKVKIVE